MLDLRDQRKNAENDLFFTGLAVAVKPGENALLARLIGGDAHDCQDPEQPDVRALRRDFHDLFRSRQGRRLIILGEQARLEISP